jgi:hypothetical protein
VNNELEWVWKEDIVAQLMCYPGICFEGLRKNHKELTIVDDLEGKKVKLFLCLIKHYTMKAYGGMNV